MADRKRGVKSQFRKSLEGIERGSFGKKEGGEKERERKKAREDGCKADAARCTSQKQKHEIRRSGIRQRI